jgi:hypothetical protein
MFIPTFDDDTDIGTMETTAGINPFADMYTGAGEFDVTAPKTEADNVLMNIGNTPPDAFSYLDVSDEDLLGPTQTTTKGPPSVLNPYQAPGTLAGTADLPNIMGEADLSDEHYDITPDAPQVLPDYDTVGMVDEYDEFEREFPELSKKAEPPVSMAKARRLMTEPVSIQMPTARTPISIGEIDPYQESYVLPNDILTQPMSKFDVRKKKENIVADRSFVEQISDISDRQPEVIEQKKNDLADIYDRQVERGEREDKPTVTSKTNKAKEVIGMPQMLGDVGGGDDRGGGGGKIVCTMMNESYGFGSFRNKIWLRHSKGLAPEYQKGYHKIFLPLVKLSKKNKLLKKTLEHIAVHRTIDIRQEAKGKVHLLGRVYRKILEPICYWVGKYAKK